MTGPGARFGSRGSRAQPGTSARGFRRGPDDGAPGHQVRRTGMISAAKVSYVDM